MRNTACKMRTLDPVWNESFEIPLDDLFDQETAAASTVEQPDTLDDGAFLRVDVWNFLPADEKFR